MSDNLDISNYLNDVLKDWRESRGGFPHNTHPEYQWPIPFFGNPATALVATVGVNPSSMEFVPDRNWGAVRTETDWHQRLDRYFTGAIPAYEWFNPWRAGLRLLDFSYGQCAAGHPCLMRHRGCSGLLPPSKFGSAGCR